MAPALGGLAAGFRGAATLRERTICAVACACVGAASLASCARSAWAWAAFGPPAAMAARSVAMAASPAFSGPANGSGGGGGGGTGAPASFASGFAGGKAKRARPRAPDRRPHKLWELRLYVAGQTPNALRALANLKRICEDHLRGRYSLEVVDLLETARLLLGLVPRRWREATDPQGRRHQWLEASRCADVAREVTDPASVLLWLRPVDDERDEAAAQAEHDWLAAQIPQHFAGRRLSDFASVLHNRGAFWPAGQQAESIDGLLAQRMMERAR